MKKIMFNDKFGLTKAVLEGRKTMTRRIVNCKICQDLLTRFQYKGIDITQDDTALQHSKYKIGETVAIAQAYKEVINEILINQGCKTDINTLVYKRHKGWNNKMFVRADLMPHRIQITDIKIERLHDISSEDCLKEGIQNKSCFLRKPAFPYYFEGRKHRWDNSFSTPRKAFAALINKVSGKGIWESNPFVFAYTFKLLD